MSKNQQRSALQLVHEITPEGRHRIVVVGPEGNTIGDWAESHQLATHLDLFANTGGIECLPLGIFRVREAAYQVLA